MLAYMCPCVRACHWCMYICLYVHSVVRRQLALSMFQDGFRTQVSSRYAPVAPKQPQPPTSWRACVLDLRCCESWFIRIYDVPQLARLRDGEHDAPVCVDSPPRLPRLLSPTLLPSPSSSSSSSSLQMCAICDEPWPSLQLEEHSELCVLLHKLGMGMGCDAMLTTLANFIEEQVRAKI